MQKRVKLNNKSGAKAILVLFMILLFSNCTNNNDWQNINGTWEYRGSDSSEGYSITISNGNYSKIGWNGDVINESEGKCFININSKRHTQTLTFVPDISMNMKDTIWGDVICLDIKNLNDSWMSIQKPSRWVNFEHSKTLVFNDTFILFKVTKR